MIDYRTTAKSPLTGEKREKQHLHAGAVLVANEEPPKRRKESKLSAEAVQRTYWAKMHRDYHRARARNPRGKRQRELRNSLLEHYHDRLEALVSGMIGTLPASVIKDDCISDGLFGLMDALDAFDPDRGVRFWTYAQQRVRGSVIDGLRRLDWVPSKVRLVSARLVKSRERLWNRIGREPTLYELLDDSAVDPFEYERHGNALCQYSLYDIWEADEDDGLGPRRIEALGLAQLTPLDELAGEDCPALQVLKRICGYRDRYIAEEYFFKERTMRSIGEDLGITESRISQRVKEIEIRFREMFAHPLEMALSA